MLPNYQIKAEAKAALSGNWGNAIGIWLVGTIIMALLSSTFFGVFLTGVIVYGISAAFAFLIRTKRTNFDILFSGFQNFGTTCVAGILQWIYTFLWYLLFLITGIVKSYSYAMTYYIILDNPNLSANEAITESRKLMYGKKWKLFCLDFSFIGWILLTILTFGLLSLYVQPYHEAARARFYEDIKAQPTVEG